MKVFDSGAGFAQRQQRVPLADLRVAQTDLAGFTASDGVEAGRQLERFEA
jgi:hypothetical protein